MLTNFKQDFYYSFGDERMNEAHQKRTLNNPEYKELSKQKNKLFDELKALSDEKSYKLLDEYLNTCNLMDSIEQHDAYLVGLKDGWEIKRELDFDAEPGESKAYREIYEIIEADPDYQKEETKCNELWEKLKEQVPTAEYRHMLSEFDSSTTYMRVRAVDIAMNEAVARL